MYVETVTSVLFRPSLQLPRIWLGLWKQVPLREDLERVLVRLPCWEEGFGLTWPVGTLRNGYTKVISCGRAAQCQAGATSRTSKRVSFLVSLVSKA